MNPWIIHVKAFRAANPTVSYKDCLKQAKATYVSPKTGASRGRIIGKDLDLKKATTKEFGLEMRKGAGASKKKKQKGGFISTPFGNFNPFL
jgi:hypothetical protein